MKEYLNEMLMVILETDFYKRLEIEKERIKF